jgi:NAD(P)-dependent dehydrogenase (short-subunit alcohol dehydrogenase family)
MMTGATTELGLEAVRHCMRHDAAKVIVQSAPNPRASGQRTTSKRAHIIVVWWSKLTSRPGSYDSVKELVESGAQSPRVDTIIDNAGVNDGVEGRRRP